MQLEKVQIENFKGFKSKFTITLNAGVSVIVGDNEAGKSTILEAINLALTGVYNGRYVRNEISQYLFNESSVREYVDSLKGAEHKAPPTVLIELHMSGENLAILEGDGNSERKPAAGVYSKSNSTSVLETNTRLSLRQERLQLFRSSTSG